MGVHIRGRKVLIRAINGDPLEFDLANVVFATSSHLEDKVHIERIKFNHKVHHTRALTVSSGA